jgi:succinate dehydrogenase hydrophobic anchor subunit
MSTIGGTGQWSADSPADDVADHVDDAVRENPAIEHLTRLGWIAKGVVYILMGGTAVSIARHSASSGSDEASPKGSLEQVLEQPGGRVMIGVLAVGLALYCIWRVLSVAVIRSNDLHAWADRIGYSFSAIFYGVLTFVAAKAAVNGVQPEKDNTIETWSTEIMGWTFGRWLIGAAGVVVLAIGAYFIVSKGIQRGFCKDLTGVSGRADDDEIEKALVIAGVAGWIGRGVVTMLVGFFMTRAAWRFDPDDARGFDGSLRRLAEGGIGSVLVWIAAIGLILYGAFCLASHRRRRLREYNA